jgi:MFS family permease
MSISAYWRVLRDNRDFRLLWFAQIVSEIGDWLYTVAIYSLLLEFTGQAKSVALAFVLQVLPQVIVSPMAGVINDRLSRRKVMISADWARALIVACMLLVRTPGMIWFLYLLLLLETFFWAMFEPGRSAIIPNIVKGEDAAVANALSGTTWAFNFAVGFSIGGFIAAWLGREAVFAINALSFVVSALLLNRVRCHEPHLEHLPPFHPRELADFTPIIEGARYVARDKRLLATMLAKGGLGFMGANWVLLTIFGERVFPVHIGLSSNREAGMVGMSMLMGFRGVGALLGPFIGGWWAGAVESRLRIGILIGFLAGATGYFWLGHSTTLAMAAAAVALAHAGGSIIWVFSTTLLQIQTEDKFRGRVFSTEFAGAMLTAAISNSLAGTFVDMGVPVHELATWIGLVILIPAALWAWALRLWRTPKAVSS